ncbi:MAG: sigma-70 family RNA polymerase sigma factor [Rhodospirillales bacterium]|nr:sigma-70 family RNA polymerase sigma factor [Rhodospirillales bacterium]
MRASSSDIATKALRQELAGLIERIAQSRDKAAFAELFQHYAPRIKAYLIGLGADAHQAEELAQEAMLAVWRKAAQYDARKASAGTWIFTIARNLRIDALRKEKRPEFDPHDPALMPAEKQGMDDAVEHNQQSRRIREVMDQLPDDQASVIRMSFFQEKAHSEIAAELGLPLGTVKSRIRLAMGRFREEMGER